MVLITKVYYSNHLNCKLLRLFPPSTPPAETEMNEIRILVTSDEDVGVTYQGSGVDTSMGGGFPREDFTQ
jgi:hypothetical protein